MKLEANYAKDRIFKQQELIQEWEGMPENDD